MIVVFVVLSVCAVVAACAQDRPEYPVPLADRIVVNELMALFATLAYGIVSHFALALIDRFRNS